jgi:lipopolysaccharide transport system permease protein
MLEAARQIYRYRSLLWNLTAREIKARYRGSVLGFFWSLANPLLLLAVYSLVFGLIFRQRIEGAQPYPLFLISGLFPWIWVSTSILEGTMSVLANAGLIRKAAFPAELLPMVSVLSNLVHFLFALPILAAALLIGRAMGFDLGGPACLLLPLVMALHIPMIAGIVLGLSALNVHFKDVRDLTTNAITLLFFLTPILYLMSALPEKIQLVIHLNPFTPFFLAYQEVLFFGVVPGPFRWLAMGGVSALFWAVGASLFERLRDTLVEAA